MKPYVFAEVKKRVEACSFDDMISLGIGDVTLPLPLKVTKAMERASAELAEQTTFRGYSPTTGYDFLKEAILRYLYRYSISLKKEEIFVTCGAKEEIFSLSALFRKLPVFSCEPFYPVYRDVQEVFHRKIRFLQGTEQNGFLPMPEKNRRGVYFLCSPHNPSGCAYSFSQLKKWVDFCNRTHSLLVFDNAYERFITDDSPHSIFQIDGARTCAVEISSFSKFGGLTGVRCGYTVIPSEQKELQERYLALKSATSNGVSYISQRGAEAVLSEEGLLACQERIDTYLDSARMLCRFLESENIVSFGGRNSPYIYIKNPKHLGSWEFFDFLLKKAHIVCTPGNGFCNRESEFVRFSSFCTPERMREAILRMDRLF